jgi:hypothetical protein
MFVLCCVNAYQCVCVCVCVCVRARARVYYTPLTSLCLIRCVNTSTLDLVDDLRPLNPKVLCHSCFLSPSPALAP